MYHYDVIVIGSGPAGAKCAIELGEGGKKVAIVEKDVIGGVCLNRGCIPSKTYLHMVDVLNEIKRAGEHGIKVTGVKASWQNSKKRKNKNIKTIGDDTMARLKNGKVKWVQGEAQFVDKHTLKVGRKKIRAKHIVIAVGSRPLFLPFIPKSKNVVSATEILNLKQIPKSLVIIGGGVTGVEMASVFIGLGTKVTIIERSIDLLNKEDDEISGILKKSFEKRGAKVLTSHEVVSCGDIKGGAEVVYKTPKGRKRKITADKVLVVIGRVSNHDQFDLDALGIDYDGRYILLNKNYQTSVPNIFVIGDSAQKNLTAYAAEREASSVARFILAEGRPVYYEHIPVTIFSHPEIGTIGMTEEAAAERGLKYEVKRSYFKHNAKAVILGATDGMVKILVEKKTRAILGVHIIGPHATDLIHQAFIPFMQKMTVEEWSEMFWSHPVLSEVIKEALEN